MSEGWRYADIEKVSGVSTPTLCRIMRGVSVRVTVETADALRGTLPTMRHRGNPERVVDATGTIRRVKALAAVGWSLRRQSASLGYSRQFVQNLLVQSHVTAATRDRVAEMYDRLWTVVPPRSTRHERTVYSRTRAHAVRLGWAPPLAWDDDTIDDPAAVPVTDGEREPYLERLDMAVVEQVVNGVRLRMTPRERREVVRRLYWRQWSDPKIGAHIGGSADQVQRIRAELDLPAFDQNDLEERAA